MTASAPLAQRLFARLAQGQPGDAPRVFRSGQALAAELGVSRSAIWKAAGQLRALGVGVEALRHEGYRLARPTAPLDAARIAAALADAAGQLRRGECVWQTPSTNAQLLAQGGLAPEAFDFLAAEYQSAGRGRRGRSWVAPPGGALCLSYSWSFEVLPPASGALSLAVGVTALDALARCGITGVGLKWPNDLVTADGKLGGILIELKSESGGPTHVVVGIGVNVALSPAVREAVAQTGNRATDLAALGHGSVDRNRLAAALITCGTRGLRQFARSGFAPFIAAYRDADVLQGLSIAVLGPQSTVTGTAAGIDADGALLLNGAAGAQRIVSGDVSVRTTS